jgi:hypothetical protein
MWCALRNNTKYSIREGNDMTVKHENIFNKYPHLLRNPHPPNATMPVDPVVDPPPRERNSCLERAMR